MILTQLLPALWSLGFALISSGVESIYGFKAPHLTCFPPRQSELKITFYAKATVVQRSKFNLALALGH